MINWYKIKAYYIQQYLDDLNNELHKSTTD